MTTLANDTQADDVRVRHLSRSFAGRTVLDNLDLDVSAGDFVALLGASGGGKSTLLKILAGLDDPDPGRPNLPTELQIPSERVVAFQTPRLMPWKRVWQSVVLGLKTDNSREHALTALAEVGLSNHADAWPRTLSGGEAQRVALARALVRTPKLLLLDEPFAALDALTRLKAQRLVQDLWKAHGFTVLLVTHDVDEALLLADRVLVLDQGRIALDVVVGAEHPRTAAHPHINALRTQLLAQLGVDVA